MTEIQAAEMILILGEIRDYLQAINIVVVDFQPYIVFSAILLTLGTGMYIGTKWGK